MLVFLREVLIPRNVAVHVQYGFHPREIFRRVTLLKNDYAQVGIGNEDDADRIESVDSTVELRYCHDDHFVLESNMLATTGTWDYSMEYLLSH